MSQGSFRFLFAWKLVFVTPAHVFLCSQSDRWFFKGFLVGLLGRIQSQSWQFRIKGHTHRKALRADLSWSACLPDTSLQGEWECRKTQANIEANGRRAPTSEHRDLQHYNRICEIAETFAPGIPGIPSRPSTPGKPWWRITSINAVSCLQMQGGWHYWGWETYSLPFWTRNTCDSSWPLCALK